MIQKMCRMITSALLVFVLVFAVSSCASTNVVNDVSTLKKYDDAFLWEINGRDSNGAPSKLYVLGTIHVGDNRLYPLPDSVLTAFEQSDRYVAELSTADFGKMVPELLNKQMASMKSEAERVARTGKPLISYFTEKEINFLVKFFGSMEIVKGLAAFEPWVINSSLVVYPIQQSGLDATKGIDSCLIEMSSKNHKYVEGLDSLELQLDLLSYGDWDTQLAMLKDLIEEYIEDPLNSGKELSELYDTYLTYNEVLLGDFMDADLNEDTKPYEKAYNNAMFHERNAAWAEKFADYLKQGGTTFIFAGSGHFVGKDSVFNIMKANNTLR